ncbi:MAG: 3-isopropylmalate dehydratase small subunit [Thermodesulfobacteriota bacterium]
MQYDGQARKVGDHIDTDAIIPARFLTTSDTAELGRNCFEGLEHGWIKRVNKGDILVAGKNFGCGSSREHAPLAILGAGIPVVVAQSFARIFYRNGFNMGLLLIELGDAVEKINDGDNLKVEPASGVVKNMDSGQEFKTRPVPEFMQELLRAGGLIPYVRENIQKRGMHEL